MLSQLGRNRVHKARLTLKTFPLTLISVLLPDDNIFWFLQTVRIMKDLIGIIIPDMSIAGLNNLCYNALTKLVLIHGENPFKW